jgi:protein phosphatase
MIPAERAHLKASALSHPGMSGKNNEDRYAVAAFRTEGERPLPVLFAIVSDGIGGHRAGEIAAEMVVETVSKAVANSNASNPIQTLRESIMRSSQEILVQAESNPEKKGMGATCASAMIVGDRLYIAYVGDSRIYLLRNGNVQQISIDHTWVQEAIDAGILEPEKGKEHPNAHVIRRYLGSKQPVEPDTRLRFTPGETNERSEANQGLHLRPNDLVLLCSDGLTDLVKDDEILKMVQSNPQEQALKKLVELANQRGGHDNITIVALRVPDTLPEATQPISLPTQPARKKRPAWLILVLGLVVLLIILFAAIGAFLFFQRSAGSLTAQTATASSVFTEPAVIISPLATEVETTPTSPVIQPSQTTAALPEPTMPRVTLTPWPTNTLLP